MDEYVVLDIETTGLYYEVWDEPIEVCAIKTVDGEDQIFHKYIHPYRKLSSEIESLTHITNKFLENKENKYKVLPALREFIGDRIVVGHNSSFDVQFLNFWFNVLGLPLITQRICTMKNFKRITGRKKGALQDALDYYCIVNNQAHSAIEDTKATYKLFKVMSSENDINIESFTDREAYLEIMKRVCKSRSHSKIREILCDVSYDDKERNVIAASKQYLINGFEHFQTPMAIYPKVSQSYDEIIDVFRNWLNNINVSKFYKYISDSTVYNFAKSIVSRVNSFEELKELHKEMYKTDDINLFYYAIVYRLERESDKMVYTLNDFDYYFGRGTTIAELCKKSKLPESTVINFFVDWAQNNKEINKPLIRNYLVGKKGLNSAIINGPQDEKEKITLTLYKKHFFDI